MRRREGFDRCACALALAGALALGGCGALHRAGGGASAGAALASPEPRAADARAATAKADAKADAGRDAHGEDELTAARSRAALEPLEPYWPFREAELVLERAGASSSADAAAALERSLARDPGYVPATALLSRLDFAAGRHEAAIARLEPYRMPQAGVSDAERRTLLEGLALHYDAIGRLDTADAVAREAREAGAPSGDSPASPRVYLVLRGDHPDEASGPAAEALKHGPETAVNRNNYGITRLRAGDVDGARAAFERAIEIDPALPGPYYNLALLERHYRFDERAASRWLELYRKRSNDDPDGMFASSPEPAEADTTRGR
jgi:Tfp pilus assembly protein PilF